MRETAGQPQLQIVKTHFLAQVGRLRKTWWLAALGSLFGAGLGMSVAQAQQESSEASEAIEEVIVTGSYIKSSPKDGASPVDIISRDYIDEIGATSIADITRNIAANSGSENVADSFTAGATQGTSNVNLRGLGLGSTLVLVNGRRNTLAAATANDGSSFVDTSMIPAIAVQRVEVLKEGAASIYGSDAVAGVVNYIARTDFEGTEIGAFYQSTTSDSQKDKQISLLHGWSSDRTHIVIAAQYLDRSPLSSADRPTLVQRAVSGLGNSFLLFGPSTVASGPYAGTYSALTNVPDANCVPAGGVIIPQLSASGASTGDRCGFSYGPRFNVVNKEERTHLYANVEHELSNSLALSVEAMWAKVKVLDNPQSPSYPALAYLSPSRAITPTQAGNPFGVPILWLGRPLGSAFPSPNAPRNNEHYRLALELDGEIGNYHFNTALTQSTYEANGSQPDTSTSRFGAAIAGTGGPNGDLSWDLFNPANNSQALIDFVSARQETSTDTNLAVFDFVLDGELGSKIGFAAGLQVRHEKLEISRNDVSRVEFDNAGNLTKPADLIFLGGGVNVDESRAAWGVFSEFQWDVTDALEFRLAGRYEGLDSGSTFDPKLSMRFQPLDGLVLRASASSSYREASLHQLYASLVGLQGIQDFNADGTSKAGTVFIRIAQNANAELTAEKANNWNIGVVAGSTNSYISLDLWGVDYTDVITIENAQGKVKTDPAQSDVKRTTTGSLTGVTTNYFNAASVDTKGVDLTVAYLFPESQVGTFNLTLNATYMLHYKIPINSQTVNVVGLFNHDNFARSLPETKANATFRWSKHNHKASIAARYTSSYKTTRAKPPAGFSQDIDKFLTWDLQYNYDLALSKVNARITVGVLNVMDKEPPLVWDDVNFSYDPRQHDARGRMVYAGLKFGF